MSNNTPSNSRLFALALIGAGLFATASCKPTNAPEVSEENLLNLFKTCAPVNGGPVYSIHHSMLEDFRHRLKEVSENSETANHIYIEVKSHALRKLEASSCFEWQPPTPIDDKLCKQFIECQKEIFPYSESVKSGRPESSGADDIEGLFKTCAIVNGGPVYPFHNYVFNKMTSQLGARPDNLDAVDAIYPQLHAEAEAKLRERLPACMSWQNFDGTEEALCHQFIECQKEIFPYEAD